MVVLLFSFIDSSSRKFLSLLSNSSKAEETSWTLLLLRLFLVFGFVCSKEKELEMISCQLVEFVIVQMNACKSEGLQDSTSNTIEQKAV